MILTSFSRQQVCAALSLCRDGRNDTASAMHSHRAATHQLCAESAPPVLLEAAASPTTTQASPRRVAAFSCLIYGNQTTSEHCSRIDTSFDAAVCATVVARQQRSHEWRRACYCIWPLDPSSSSGYNSCTAPSAGIMARYRARSSRNRNNGAHSLTRSFYTRNSMYAAENRNLAEMWRGSANL